MLSCFVLNFLLEQLHLHPYLQLPPVDTYLSYISLDILFIYISKLPFPFPYLDDLHASQPVQNWFTFSLKSTFLIPTVMNGITICKFAQLATSKWFYLSKFSSNSKCYLKSLGANSLFSSLCLINKVKIKAPFLCHSWITTKMGDEQDLSWYPISYQVLSFSAVSVTFPSLFSSTLTALCYDGSDLNWLSWLWTSESSM